ncbi:MAG TPA: thiolase domain-containing protein [Dehalococcoidia bacterium]|nr:thiolase domain-containing protein [Dehalococcoidia bacterium]
MNQEVAVIGVGQTAFNRNCGISIRELCFEAYREAVAGLTLSPRNVNASIICSAPEYDKQRTPAALISEYMGFTPSPTFYVESVCSASTSGTRVAFSMIKAGLHDIIVVIGFQKMSEISSREAAEVMGRGDDTMFSSPFGTTMPAGHALYAKAHMEKYGTTQEQMAKIRVKNSHYGSLNPKANYRKALSLEDVMTSAPVCDPLKVFDCCANADGASCIILASAEKAKKLTAKPVWVMGLGMATSELNWSARSSNTSFPCTQKAAQTAYKMAGVGPQDIDVAEVHDCFTISEILAYEDLGFAKAGEGPKLIEDKQTYHDGKIPVNVDGGLLSKGHPIGATGGSQIRTIVRQLRGESNEAQVKNAKIGLVQNVGGTGTYANVIIFGR